MDRYSHEPESLRGLLLRHRTRTGLIQRDLAARVGVSLRSLQDWEAGLTYPTPERLQTLSRVFLEAGGLTPGREMAEVRELWMAAERERPRMHTPFDEQWFAGVLASRATTTATSPRDGQHAVAATELKIGPLERAQDWGEAPDTTAFVGRDEESALVQAWVLDEHCRLVALLGMGGIGKTSLAACVAQKVAPSFDRLYWRSLRNAPPVSEWLAGAIGFLSDQQVVPPPSESDRITALLQSMRSRRCLLVLDNSETLFEAGQGEGRYRTGMEGYGRVLQAIGETAHPSCLLVTSREAPPELGVLTGARHLELHGLGIAEAQALLADRELVANGQSWRSLVERYGGNGLALKIVGETIRQVYDGDVNAFLAEAVATYGTVFGGIRRLLDVQVERLSPIEWDVLMRLAVEREPITLAELARDMLPPSTPGAVVDAIETLRRRSLVERGERGATFTLQSMVLEYMTDRLVESVADEIDAGEAAVLVEQPLIKAQARDYVRQTQERLIGVPVLQRLTAEHGETGTTQHLISLLEAWRDKTAAEQGFGPGNVVNLLRLLRGNLRGLDLSRLAIRHSFLQGVEAQDASLVGAHLGEAVLDEPFAYPTALALGADGGLLVAGTPAGDVRLWRTFDRRLVQAVQAHTGMVWGVALSDDGRLVASGGDDALIRIWRADSGESVARLQGHTGPVWGLALSADGRVAASGGEDTLVRLWDTDRGELLASLQGHAAGVRAVALSQDGRMVASGGDDLTIRIWEVATGKLLTTLEGHTGVVYGVALSGDGARVISGSVDGTVRLWDPARGELLNTLEAHPGGLRGVALSTDGRLAASGGGDGLVRLWDADTGQLLANMPGHTGAVWCMSLSDDGHLVASGSQDGTVRLWEARSGQLVAAVQGHTGVILSTAVLDGGRLVATGGVDGLVRLWNSEAGLLATLQGHTGLVRGVAISEDGRLVASGGDDGLVRLWDCQAARSVATLEGHTGTIWCLALSADGTRVATGGVDNTVRLWDAQTGQALAVLQGHNSLVWGVAISADGRVAASASLDGTARLWDVDRRELVATLHSNSGALWGATLSGDGRLVACGCVDGAVRMWEAATGRLLATLRGHAGLVYAVALSADGALLASGGADGMLRLWDTVTGEPLAALQAHNGVVWGVAISPDGQVVASGGDDGMLRLWDASSGTCLNTLQADRHYQRLDITGLTGVTEAQRSSLVAMGATDRSA